MTEFETIQTRLTAPFDQAVKALAEMFEANEGLLTVAVRDITQRIAEADAAGDRPDDEVIYRLALVGVAVTALTLHQRENP